MIPPTTNELKLHSDNLADFGKNLHKLNGAGKALVNVAVLAVALIAATAVLLPVAAAVV